MTTISEQRRARFESFLPKVQEAATGPGAKARAFVFRKAVGWLNEENFFEASFANPQYARDFVSMMEGMEYTWTIVEVHWDEDHPMLGTISEFNGGIQIGRAIPG